MNRSQRSVMCALVIILLAGCGAGTTSPTPARSSVPASAVAPGPTGDGRLANGRIALNVEFRPNGDDFRAGTGYVALVIMKADGSDPAEIWHPTPNTDNFTIAPSWGTAP